MVTWDVDWAVATGDVGLGGVPSAVVVPDTVTPEELSPGVLEFTAQTRMEYWVPGVRPVRAWLVPLIAVNWAAEQSVGAVAPGA
jgi:hypothetical protein